MDGILLVKKPVGITSRDVVNKTCKILGTKKVGHTGTLDPFASGLLVLTVGKGTKAGQFLEKEEKEYVAVLKLGIDTDSFDLTGNVVSTSRVPSFNFHQLDKIAKSFLGEISQQVPIYSAIKIDGKKLYEYAREGNEIECPKRNVFIKEFDILGFDDDSIIFRVVCSKGTYIRTLGRDFAIKLGTIGHLTELERTRIGNLSIKKSVDIDDISQDKIISVADSITSIPKVIIEDEQTILDIKNGKHRKFDFITKEVFVVDKNNNPIAVLMREDNGYYSILRGLF
ncbi:MAG: tRNA pseudouridine(55) synthase TruB [Bacilli bacterium]|nr:tRNA pseudouridine(55) synthase TruB [Bacilli bacterium]